MPGSRVALETTLDDGDVNARCFLGYHDASAHVKNAPGTWVYAAYSTPWALAGRDIADVHTLSHEVFEWITDPYLDNRTPEWFADGFDSFDGPATGCG